VRRTLLDGVGDFEECAITRIFIGQMVDICYEFSVHVCEFVMQIEDRVDERNSGVGPPDLSIFDSQAPMCINFVKCASGLSNQHSVDHSPYMIGANGSVRGKKEFEPSSLAAESEPLLGPHLEDY
jgi:hypothetical protein